VISDFIEGKVDRVYLAFNEFKNAGTQVTRVIQILPVKPETAVDPNAIDYIYEPSKEELLSRLVPLYIQNQIFRANLESLASFFGAQRMAMENATKSAGEMIQRYTLQYNRARQASITKELLEIISGAEALKG
jgi:F-type H+-transporting ATPase subunit gamma